ncbi:MAG: hypothetical protein ACXWZT_12890, partial [Gaiellaceae bacterium]
MTETTVTPERPLVVEEGDVKPGFIGQNIPRKEDKRLVQGEGVFFDDVKRHEMGYVHFVRSPYAHARIGGIDASAASALPGVRVFTAADSDLGTFQPPPIPGLDQR